MKIQTTRVQTVEKEIELPYFCKHEDYYLKVVDESSVIAVVTRHTQLIADWCVAAVKYKIQEGEEISEQEFKAAFYQALSAIQSKVINTKIPT